MARGGAHLTTQIHPRRYPKPPISRGLERRASHFPKAIREVSVSLSASTGEEDGFAESPPIPQSLISHSPAQWVEEHSLLPQLHGDEAMQRVVESMGHTSRGFKS